MSHAPRPYSRPSRTSARERVARPAASGSYGDGVDVAVQEQARAAAGAGGTARSSCGRPSKPRPGGDERLAGERLGRPARTGRSRRRRRRRRSARKPCSSRLVARRIVRLPRRRVEARSGGCDCDDVVDAAGDLVDDLSLDRAVDSRGILTRGQDVSHRPRSDLDAPSLLDRQRALHPAARWPSTEQ